MELLKGQTAPEIWLIAAEHLRGRKSHEDCDVFLNVATPTVLSQKDVVVLGRVDDFLTSRGGYPVNTVAETIFPLDDYLRGGAKGVFETYPPRMREIHKARSDRRWGCYALRLLRQQDHEGKEFNPLKELMEKINKHGQFRACYELGLGRPFEGDVAIYDAVLDRKPVYGNIPCLSHISVKVYDGLVRLNATYRSHYYVQRLLGNLIGLGRLQFFIAQETGLHVGSLTINSTFARLDTGGDNGKNRRWGQRDIAKLLKTCRAIYEECAAP